MVSRWVMFQMLRMEQLLQYKHPVAQCLMAGVWGLEWVGTFGYAMLEVIHTHTSHAIAIIQETLKAFQACLQFQTKFDGSGARFLHMQ